MKQPFQYTSRREKTYYIRAIPNRNGTLRYSLTQKADAPNLLAEVPAGFEVVEYPFQAKVVIRKKVPNWVKEEERAVVRQAMEEYSPVNDFLLETDRGEILIHVSQFNHFEESGYLSQEEAKAQWGENVHLWITYDWLLSFRRPSQKSKKWQVIVNAPFAGEAFIIESGTNLSELAATFCAHVGKDSLFDFLEPE
ncbi:MAG: hypothetical protein AAFU60_12050 [Bacteroidota bacterium]